MVVAQDVISWRDSRIISAIIDGCGDGTACDPIVADAVSSLCGTYPIPQQLDAHLRIISEDVDFLILKGTAVITAICK